MLPGGRPGGGHLQPYLGPWGLHRIWAVVVVVPRVSVRSELWGHAWVWCPVRQGLGCQPNPQWSARGPGLPVPHRARVREGPLRAVAFCPRACLKPCWPAVSTAHTAEVWPGLGRGSRFWSIARLCLRLLRGQEPEAPGPRAAVRILCPGIRAAPASWPPASPAWPGWPWLPQDPELREWQLARGRSALTCPMVQP